MTTREFRFYYFTPVYDETVAFYRDVLGFEVYTSWERAESDRGTIFRSPNGSGFVEIETGFRIPSLAGGFYIEVDDVDGWYEAVRGRGAPVLEELGTTHYGHRNFKTADPSGVEVTFFEYVTRPPHAEGDGGE